MSRYSAGSGHAGRFATVNISKDADSSRTNASTSSSSSSILSRYCETSSRPAASTTNNAALYESDLVRKLNSTSLDDSQSSKSRPAGFSVFGHVPGSSQRDKPSYASSGSTATQFCRNGVGAGSKVGGTQSPVAGYQAPRPFHTSSSSSGSIQQSDIIAQLEKQLETEKQENIQLQEAVDAKDKRISELQKEIELLNKECDDLDADNMQLQEENQALIRAMSKLASKS